MNQKIIPKPRPKYEDLTDNQKRRLIRTYINNLNDKEKSIFLNKAIKKVYPKSFPKPKIKKNGKIK